MRQDWKEDRRREKEEDMVYGLILAGIILAIALLLVVY